MCSHATLVAGRNTISAKTVVFCRNLLFLLQASRWLSFILYDFTGLSMQPNSLSSGPCHPGLPCCKLNEKGMRKKDSPLLMQIKWEEWHVDWVGPRWNFVVVPERVELISEIAFGTLKRTSILIDFSRLNLKVEYATLPADRRLQVGETTSFRLNAFCVRHLFTGKL